MRKFIFASLASSVAPVAFMSGEVVETVVAGGVRVNKADYDANPKAYGSLDKAATAEDAALNVETTGGAASLPEGATTVPAPSAAVRILGEDKTVAPSQPSPGQLVVFKGGTAKKPVYTVTDTQGEPVKEMEGIDPNGYATEADAWAAITNALAIAQRQLPPVQNAPQS